MRILYICADLGIPVLGRHGCSTHVRETCHALRKAGHEVTVLCSLLGGDQTLGEGLDFEIVKPPQSKKMGYDLRNLWHNLAIYKRAKKIVEEKKIEAIYERFSLYSVAGIWTSNHYKLPRILEINAFMTVEHAEKLHWPWLAKKIEKHIAQSTPSVIVVSQPLKDTLMDMGVPAHRITIMPLGVDLTHFTPDAPGASAVREKFGLVGRYVIGYVGALTGWHGIRLLYDMAQMIRKERDDFTIFVVGGDKVRLEKHRRKVEEAGLGDHLLFVGSVSYEQVPDYIGAMDVALVPDTNHWTCPTKMFEYQASAVPTIAPKYPAILKAMDDGKEGLLFEPKNVKQAVQRILSVADAPDKRREMGKAARDRVSAMRSWNNNVNQIIEMFSQCD